MRFRKLFWIGGLSLAGFLALAGFRGAGHCHRGMSDDDIQAHSDRVLERALDTLEATDAQRATLADIKKEVLQDGLTLRAERKEAQAELLEVWNQANPDPADVHARLDARIDRLRAFAHKLADAALEAHQTLTPEQRAKVAEKIEAHHR